MIFSKELQGRLSETKRLDDNPEWGISKITFSSFIFFIRFETQRGSDNPEGSTISVYLTESPKA